MDGRRITYVIAPSSARAMTKACGGGPRNLSLSSWRLTDDSLSMNIETKANTQKEHSIPLKDDDRLQSLATTFPNTCRGQRARQTLITDDVVWQLPYAPAIGHPAQLSGREEVVRHVTWFVGAVENFRFYDLKVHAFTDPESAVAEVKAEGLIKSTGLIYLQDYVLFLRVAGDKIAFLREYFDPVRAAKAMDTPILGLES
jgi:uncharacterized protein